MQVIYIKNNGLASFGGRSLDYNNTYIFLPNINRKETMINFGEVASRFYKLGKNKNMDNGLYLHTLMLFHSMCHLKEGTLSVENANKKFYELYGKLLNSASLSRNNAVLVNLGLIKLYESSSDRRQKEIIFTTVGHKFKNLFNDIPKAREAM